MNENEIIINAKELRIGNLFHYGKRLAEVNVIYRTHFSCEEYKTRISFGNSIQQNFQPILLTEEWLLNFGFNKTNRIDSGEFKECYAIFSLAVMIRHNLFFIDWVGGNTQMKYVHQLQNIYFALTEEELEIKNE